MKSFREFIEESFDSKPAKWKIIRSQYNDFLEMLTAEFTIDDVRYEVDVDYDDSSYTHEIEFGIPFGRISKDTGLAGTGNQYKVLVTVIDITKYIIKKWDNVAVIEFHANKNSKARASVYERLVKKELGRMSGWKMKKNSTGNSVTFTLQNPARMKKLEQEYGGY